MQMARHMGTALIGGAVVATALAAAAFQQNPAWFHQPETQLLWLAGAGAALVATLIGITLLRLSGGALPSRGTMRMAVAPVERAPAPREAATGPATAEPAPNPGLGALAPLLLTLAEEELARVEEAMAASDPEAARDAALRLSEAAQAMGLAGLAGDTLALAEWLAATPPEADGTAGAVAGIRGALDELSSRSG